MNFIKKMFKRNRILPSDMNIDTFNKLIQGVNETTTALIFDDYLSKSDIKIHTKFIKKLLHFSSNRAITDRIFSEQLIKLNSHYKMFYKSENKLQKWLMYSALWNIFRYDENRERIDNKFLTLILSDF